MKLHKWRVKDDTLRYLESFTVPVVLGLPLMLLLLFPLDLNGNLGR